MKKFTEDCLEPSKFLEWIDEFTKLVFKRVPNDDKFTEEYHDIISFVKDNPEFENDPYVTFTMSDVLFKLFDLINKTNDFTLLSILEKALYIIEIDIDKHSNAMLKQAIYDPAGYKEIAESVAYSKMAYQTFSRSWERLLNKLGKDPDYDSIIGDNLKDLIDFYGITQVNLASIVGISKSAVGKWLKGISNPRIPHLEKIANHFGLEISNLLEKDGFKSSKTFQQKNLTYKVDESSYLIPILGNVAAGVPISEQSDILGYEELDTSWQSRGKFFALKIKGNSMFPDFKDDDTIIVKEQEDIENGQIGVVQVNGDEHTVKKVKISDGGITLIPLNINEYEPVFYDCNEVKELPVKILGVVFEVRRRFY